MGGAGRSIHPRLLTHGSRTAGRRASIFAGLALFAWLVPAFALTATESRWDPVLLGSLAAIAMTSYFGAVALRTATALDGAFIAALVAVVLLGPLPAACIWVATEIAAFFVQQRRFEAFVANTASFSAATLAAAAVLAVLVGELPVDAGSLGATAYAVIALAGVAMLVENFLVGAVLIDVLRDRRRLLPVVHAELVRTAPATVAMIVVGTLTVFLYAHIHVLALALFALVVIAPQLLLPGLLRPRSMHELYHTRRRGALRAGDRASARALARRAAGPEGRRRLHAGVRAAPATNGSATPGTPIATSSSRPCSTTARASTDMVASRVPSAGR